MWSHPDRGLLASVIYHLHTLPSGKAIGDGDEKTVEYVCKGMQILSLWPDLFQAHYHFVPILIRLFV